MKDGTFISQMKYTHDMLKKFDMVNAKPIKTPMPTNGHLDLNDEGKAVDTKVYRSMIGSCRGPNTGVPQKVEPITTER